MQNQTLTEVLRSDLQRYKKKADYNNLLTVVEAVYSHPSFVGVVWYRVGHALWLRRKNPFWFILLGISRLLYPIIRAYSGLELSPRAQIGSGLWIGHFGPTVIHPDVVAGNNLTVLHGVTIGASKSGVPKLGDDVSIGTRATVIGGIHIADKALIGAGAVVTTDVARGSVVVGIPAKPVGLQSDEIDLV
jgi:serine O-acetyltransferase